jgi:hypothetical protein
MSEIALSQFSNEKLDYTIDFTDFLGSDTIKTSGGITVTSTPPTELTITSTNTTKTVTLLISGGTAGRTYAVSCLMESTAGHKKRVDFNLSIKA